MYTKSFQPKPAETVESWFLVDAEGQTVGRLASRVAGMLRGKHLPTFAPNCNPRVHVVVVNADKVVFTGKKWTDKTYVSHSMWRGGFKEISARHLREKKPGEVLRRAIAGMLPHTRLGDVLRKNLRVFAGPEHTHAVQKPVKIDLAPAATSGA